MYNYCLFIDDDDAINFLHKMIVEKMQLARKQEFINKAEEALAHLRNLDEQQMPDIVFLDINMPKINGWKFLELFGELQLTFPPKFIMLTTSINPEDKIRAEKNPLVHDFLTKPLSSEKILHVLSQYAS